MDPAYHTLDPDAALARVCRTMEGPCGNLARKTAVWNEEVLSRVEAGELPYSVTLPGAQESLWITDLVKHTRRIGEDDVSQGPGLMYAELEKRDRDLAGDSFKAKMTDLGIRATPADIHRATRVFKGFWPSVATTKILQGLAEALCFLCGDHAVRALPALMTAIKSMDPIMSVCQVLARHGHDEVVGAIIKSAYAHKKRTRDGVPMRAHIAVPSVEANVRLAVASCVEEPELARYWLDHAGDVQFMRSCVVHSQSPLLAALFTAVAVSLPLAGEERAGSIAQACLMWSLGHRHEQDCAECVRYILCQVDTVPPASAVLSATRLALANVPALDLAEPMPEGADTEPAPLKILALNTLEKYGRGGSSYASSDRYAFFAHVPLVSSTVTARAKNASFGFQLELVSSEIVAEDGFFDAKFTSDSYDVCDPLNMIIAQSRDGPAGDLRSTEEQFLAIKRYADAWVNGACADTLALMSDELCVYRVEDFDVEFDENDDSNRPFSQVKRILSQDSLAESARACEVTCTTAGADGADGGKRSVKFVLVCVLVTMRVVRSVPGPSFLNM